MENYPVKLLSCDTHIEHPATVIADYVDEKFHDVLKKCASIMNVWGGLPYQGPEGVPLGTLAGYNQFHEVRAGKIDLDSMEIPGACGGAKDYIGWLDIDHVDAAVILPGAMLSMALGLVAMSFDRDDRIEYIRGYNNFLSDFCSEYPDRLLGGACVPHTSMEDAIVELRRLRDMPGITTISPGNFPNGSSSPSEADDRFYQECIELGFPITLHGGISGAPASIKGPKDVATWIIGHTEVATGGPFSAAQLIMSGVFDRLPEMRFIVLEAGASWLPFMMSTMDHMWDRHRHWAGLDLKNPPSWYCTSGHILWNIIADRPAIEFRDRIGVGNLSWSSDFPHSNSEWPHSQVSALQLCAGIPAKERFDVLWGNAARFYGLES
jgi:predicted TIM-barrel fold metal-dependent hydrolase